MHEDAKSGWTVRLVGRRRPQIGAAAVGQKLHVKVGIGSDVRKGLEEKASSCDVTGCDGMIVAVAAWMASNLSILLACSNQTCERLGSTAAAATVAS